MKTTTLPPILIYYSFRGQLQPIRNLFCYLQINFYQIHIDLLKQEKEELPPEVFDYLSKLEINKQQLPALAYQGLVVYGQRGISLYTCKKFGREDLLGNNIYTRTKLQQILSIYFTRQPKSMEIMLKLAEYLSANRTSQEIQKNFKQAYEDYMSKSKYIKQCCQYLDKQEHPRFIFEEITLIDFFFLESCFYMLGIFDREGRVNSPDATEQQTKIGFLNKPNSYYMKVLRQYLERMTHEQFYQQKQEYLESFSILFHYKPEVIKGMKKMWAGNPKFVQ